MAAVPGGYLCYLLGTALTVPGHDLWKKPLLGGTVVATSATLQSQNAIGDALTPFLATVGNLAASTTVGASLALRKATYVDATMMNGRDRSLNGWGVSLRIAY